MTPVTGVIMFGGVFGQECVSNKILSPFIPVTISMKPLKFADKTN